MAQIHHAVKVLAAVEFADAIGLISGVFPIKRRFINKAERKRQSAVAEVALERWISMY
jgi:hypothetical protein